MPAFVSMSAPVSDVDIEPEPEWDVDCVVAAEELGSAAWDSYSLVVSTSTD